MLRMTTYLKALLADQPMAPERSARGPGSGPVVIWNLIRQCNLLCQHCYASAANKQFAGELDTAEVFRSVLCFWLDAGGRPRNAAGPRAIETYLDDPFDSRLIMSMKSYLAQRSFTETRIFGRAWTLEGLIALFL